MSEQISPLSLVQAEVAASQDLTRDVVPVYLRARGPLCLDALRKAIATLVTRHPAMTMRVVRDSTGLGQVFGGRPEPPSLDLIDAADDKEARASVIDFLSAPMDVWAGDSFRARIIKLGPDSHLVLLNLHHLYADGWGINVMLTELWQCYDAYVAGREPDLPRPTASYAEFVEAERASGDRLTGRQHEFWRAMLAGNTALSFTQPGPAQPRPRTASQIDQTVDDAALADVVRFSRSINITPSAALLAALLLALRSQCQQDDLTVGLMSSGREDRRYSRTVGLFSRGIPLRIMVDPNMEVGAYAKDVTRRWFAAVAQSQPPYSCQRLRDELGIRAWSFAEHVPGPDLDVEINFPFSPDISRLSASGLTFERLGKAARPQTFEHARLLLMIRRSRNAVVSAIYHGDYLTDETVGGTLDDFAAYAGLLPVVNAAVPLVKLDESRPSPAPKA
jgi:hypothetical protein